MNKKNRSELIAGIDIGSHYLRMKISEVNEKGEVKTIENLKRAISLGKDTFNIGKVRFETLEKACEILKGFKRVLKEYNVKTYRAVATSAIREAENREYIIDQIKLKTGLNIDVIDSAEEKFLTYKSIRENLPNYKKFRNEGALIVDVGSGSSEISIYNNGHLVFSKSIRIGSLRIKEVLSSLERRTLDFPNILEEYIESTLDAIADYRLQKEIKNFIALGGEILTISKLCNKTNNYEELKFIKMEDFLRLYEELMYKPVHQLIDKYNLSIETASILLPSVMLFKKFLDMTSSEGVYAPLVSLRDGIISDIIDKKYNTSRNKEFNEDIISSVRYMAQRYMYNNNHSYDVEEKALILFDSLKKLHGLGDRERLLLQIASILHDIGKFINLNQHYLSSYNIIISSNLIGISKSELEMIANIVRYHSDVVPSYEHENFKKLSEKNRVTVAKLVSMLRMADSLDSSHKQKIKNVKVSLKGRNVIIKGESVLDSLLEEWTFETKSEFFKEVFGYLPILKIQRVM
jgi:exopolyphosphatase/guanosine-5'-triphosphate,3'-diphosphate pyrophosphatase